MEENEWDEFMSYVHATYTPEHDGYLARVNHLMAENLCKQWDAGQGKNYTQTGFQIARSFIGETNLLPAYDAELRMSLIRMKHENTVHDFARSAWHGMAHSHPRVFAYHEMLFQFAEKELDLSSTESAAQFIAGLSLPYMMSTAACLANEAKDSEFTSMVNLSVEKHHLQSTDFSTLFSAATPLASNRPDRRNVFVEEG